MNWLSIPAIAAHREPESTTGPAETVIIRLLLLRTAMGCQGSAKSLKFKL